MHLARAYAYAVRGLERGALLTIDGEVDLLVGGLEAHLDEARVGHHQRAVGDLFEHESDPITVLTWKEMLDFLEDATERCGDVGTVLEGIVVKHG